jgi:hypothetical protein
MKSRGPSNLSRPILAVLYVTATVVVVACFVRQIVSLRTWGDLENEGGMWVTLAVDARDGILYRPLVSDIGYGGTRYGPVHIALEAAIMKAGVTPITSGFLLGAITAGITLVGIYTLMMRLKTPAPLALVMTSFFLAAFCVRSGILSIKSDLLAAGLDMWGLVAALPLMEKDSRGKKWPATIIAAICFALAAASKVTSLFGIAAVVTWLLLRKENKTAVRLMTVYLIACVILVLLVQWASQGRGIGVFLSAAGAGGGLRRLTQAPSIFFERIFSRDRAVGGFWVAALLMIFVRRNWTSLPTLLFAYSTLGTMAIFGSPGTDMNHLMDLHLASLLVLAVECQFGRFALAMLCLTVLVVLHSAHSCINDIRDMRKLNTRGNLYASLAQVDSSPVNGPLLAQNPVLPIIAGERPYLLDYFLFQVRDWKHPGFGDKMRDDLVHQRFRAVIVNPDLGAPGESSASDPWPGLLNLMQTRYEFKAKEGWNLVYLPK